MLFVKKKSNEHIKFTDYKKKCPALLGMVTHTYIPSIWKIEARKTIESKISLGYIITTSLKKKKSSGSKHDTYLSEVRKEENHCHILYII